MSAFGAALSTMCPWLGAEGLRRLEAHYELLKRWNRVLNLTAIRNEEEAVRRHYFESLYVSSLLPSRPMRIADLGSGAGFPGIPIAAGRPDCNVTLIESHQRKAVFLREATRDWPNVRVLGCRAEDVGERFDLLVSRAVLARDVLQAAATLAPEVALMVTGEPPESAVFSWRALHPLPGAGDRFVALGTVQAV